MAIKESTPSDEERELDAFLVGQIEDGMSEDYIEGARAGWHQCMAWQEDQAAPEPVGNRDEAATPDGRCVWRYEMDCGRMGAISGVFVARPSEVAAAIGNEVSFGEALGKHSDVGGTLEESEFELLGSDPAFVALVDEHGPFGRNPLGYVCYRCASCNLRIMPDEVQFNRCKAAGCGKVFCDEDCVQDAVDDGGHDAEHEVVLIDGDEEVSDDTATE